MIIAREIFSRILGGHVPPPLLRLCSFAVRGLRVKCLLVAITDYVINLQGYQRNNPSLNGVQDHSLIDDRCAIVRRYTHIQ